MMVVPRQNRVRLYYDRIFVDWLGIGVSLAALLLIIVSPLLKRTILRKKIFRD